MNGNLFLYRPGGPQGVNVFTDWASLMNAMEGQQGRKILEFDDTFSPCTIQAGTWPMTDVMWAGFGPRPGLPRTQVTILSGAQFQDLRMIGGQITIVNNVMYPAPSPVSDFIIDGENHVQIGMRDDCGNTQIVNPGNVPMFNLGPFSAFFFVQNCLFGMPLPLPRPPRFHVQPPLPVGPPEILSRRVIDGTLDPLNPSVIAASNPLIRQSAGSHLTLNLLGQNQTGPNLVLSELGAFVLFAALSSAAQVAHDQSSIGSGTILFGPQGRIQRNVLPLPPASPTTASLPFNKPNVLIRCDGSAPGFTQKLPAIVDGFTIGNTQIPLYSGGQEVVVAEVVGGTGLKVSPSANDTIDGKTGVVPIGAFGSRTLASDGVSNWITISRV
jgi:hypothetical protein